MTVREEDDSITSMDVPCYKAEVTINLFSFFDNYLVANNYIEYKPSEAEEAIKDLFEPSVAVNLKNGGAFSQPPTGLGPGNGNPIQDDIENFVISRFNKK